VTHANNAIGNELTGDTTVVSAIRALHNTHLTDPLEDNPLQRSNTLLGLGKLASSLDSNGFAGIAEVKRLRALADQTTDPQRKAELTAFANALGGALWRQRKVAREINGFVAAMNEHDLKAGGNAEAEDTIGMSHDTVLSGVVTRPTPDPPLDNVTDDDQAATAANTFQLEIPNIIRDEQTASSHITGAVSGC